MKKWNDSGRFCKLTLSWKAPSTQIRIFLKAHFYIYFSHESAFRLVFRPRAKPVNPVTETLGWFSNRTGTSVDAGKRAKRTERHFRCSICCSAIGQASCLTCARRRQLTFPLYCSISLLSFWNRSPEWFKAPSIRIQVNSYEVSKISLDSCARGLKQFKVAFAESSLECPL